MIKNAGRNAGMLVAALLLVALGFFTYSTIVSEPDSEPAVKIPADDVAANAEPPAIAVPGKAGIPDPSIAVLPFSDTSATGDQQYLSDGLPREIRDLLAQIPELRVASLRSSFQYRDNIPDLAEAASALDVAHVLTGTVQHTDDELQVTARQVAAADGTVLWSESFDRPLDAIFEIQDDIAAAVVDSLQIRSAQPMPKAEIVDADAYLLWLQGRFFYDQWDEENFERAVDANRAALKIDPDFVEAWASLAVTYLSQTQSGFREIAFGTALAHDAINKALALDPDRPSVLARLAHIQTMLQWDWEGAEQTAEKALEVAPKDTRVLGAAGNVANSLGETGKALEYLQRSLEQDPSNVITLYNIAEVLHRAGKLDEARAAYREVLALSPGDWGTHAQLALVALQMGDPEAAWQELELEVAPQQQEYGRLLALPALGRGDEVEERLRQFIERNQTWAPYQIASIYAWHGDRDNAFLWLEHAYDQRSASMTQILLEPTFVKLHDDPRWTGMLEKMGLPH